MEIDFATLWGAVTSSGALGSLAVALRARTMAKAAQASAEQERERRQRIEAETQASVEAGVRAAYSHARADLETAKRLYDAVSERERQCRSEVEALRTELHEQDQRCQRDLRAMREEMLQLRADFFGQSLSKTPPGTSGSKE